jgi:hypothetical protein
MDRQRPAYGASIATSRCYRRYADFVRMTGRFVELGCCEEVIYFVE